MSDPDYPGAVLTKILDSLAVIHPIDQAKATGSDNSFTDNLLPMLGRLTPEDRGRVKNVLLTLHFLFPHELLPALDLLDRKLVACLRLGGELREGSDRDAHSSNNYEQSRQEATQEHVTEKTSSPSSSASAVSKNAETSTELVSERYYVQSASAVTDTRAGAGTGRYKNVYQPGSMHYEVHIDSWNCTCPAFAFSSLKLLMADGPPSGRAERSLQTKLAPSKSLETVGTGDDVWEYGGTATRANSTAPICKHMLAVALVRAAPRLFGHTSTSIVQQASIEDIAGRAGGWNER